MSDTLVQDVSRCGHSQAFFFCMTFESVPVQIHIQTRYFSELFTTIFKIWDIFPGRNMETGLDASKPAGVQYLLNFPTSNVHGEKIIHPKG